MSKGVWALSPWTGSWDKIWKGVRGRWSKTIQGRHILLERFEDVIWVHRSRGWGQRAVISKASLENSYSSRAQWQLMNV